jgi:hypothetical protein
LTAVDCEKNDAGQNQQNAASEAKKEKSSASQTSRSSTSETKNEAAINTEKPSDDARQTSYPPASQAKSEKSDVGRNLQSPASGVRNEALNNSEECLKHDLQVREPPTSEAKSQEIAADHISGAKSKKMKDSGESLPKAESVDPHFAAIFVPRSGQPSILHAHLPQLIATASLAHRELPSTRLVQLPKGCDRRLCEALGLPRVSFIGVLDGAPHSKSLIDQVRECVPEIEISWLREANGSVYLPVKINAIDTFVPVAKKQQQKLIS